MPGALYQGGKFIEVFFFGGGGGPSPWYADVPGPGIKLAPHQ